MANFQISESVEINRPAETVFQYVNDISQATVWRPQISITDYSGEPFAVGTTWNEVTKFMGRDMVVKFEVTALEAGRYCEMKMDGGPVTGNTTWDISPASDESSTAKLSFNGEVTGWMMGLVSGLLRNQAQKDMKKDLGNLKSILEST
jgi:uncharacterized protein YndB with AHSA1/START domain